MTTQKRICEVPHCGEVIPMGLLMCSAHWELVPQDLQRKIYRLYHAVRRGRYREVKAEYDAAIERAVQVAQEQTGVQSDSAYRNGEAEQ